MAKAKSSKPANKNVEKIVSDLETREGLQQKQKVGEKFGTVKPAIAGKESTESIKQPAVKESTVGTKFGTVKAAVKPAAEKKAYQPKQQFNITQPANATGQRSIQDKIRHNRK